MDLVLNFVCSLIIRLVLSTVITFIRTMKGIIFAKLTNDTNEGKIVELSEGTGFMQGIFVEYGITIDDDVTEVRNGGFGSTTK
mgnify:CR=1 FL=1